MRISCRTRHGRAESSKQIRAVAVQVERGDLRRSRAPGPIAELDPEAVRKALEISAFGGFLVVQQAARRMTPHGHGAILLTGARASVKGYPLSSAFAMGKFALRGLAQR